MVYSFQKGEEKMTKKVNVTINLNITIPVPVTHETLLTLQDGEASKYDDAVRKLDDAATATIYKLLRDVEVTCFSLEAIEDPETEMLYWES